MIKAFDDYFIGETSVTYERYLLNRRVQESNETFDAFMTDLRRLIKSCDYGALEESILKDRVVTGIREDGIRRKLLQIRKLDLAAAIDVCRASETATRHLKEFRGTESVQRLTSSKTSRNRHRSASRTDYRRGDARSRDERSVERTTRHGDEQKTTYRKCKYCHKNHEFKKECCPAYGKLCKACHKMNHFAASSLCTAKKSGSEQTRSCRMINTESEDVFALHSETNSIQKKIMVRMSIKNRLISFQLDSGATVNILPEALAREALGKHFKMRAADAVLSMYDKSVLKTIGMITAVVSNPKTDETFEFDFYITRNYHVPILGSVACQQMKLLTVNYENVLALDNQVGVTSLSHNVISEKFSDVFTGYGKLEGEAHLETDPSVT